MKNIGISGNPQTLQILLHKIANGGDSIVTYYSFFIDAQPVSIAVDLTVFYSMLIIWFSVAFGWAHYKTFVELAKEQKRIAPIRNIGLGILILSHSILFSL